MDKLPATLLPRLLALLLRHDAIVVGDVTADSTDEDEADDTPEEEHDEEGTADGEPVHLIIVAAGHGEVGVPPGGPLDLAVLPADIIRPDDFGVLLVDDHGSTAGVHRGHRDTVVAAR